MGKHPRVCSLQRAFIQPFWSSRLIKSITTAPSQLLANGRARAGGHQKVVIVLSSLMDDYQKLMDGHLTLMDDDQKVMAGHQSLIIDHQKVIVVLSGLMDGHQKVMNDDQKEMNDHLRR